jgi:hypothetical protein
MMGPETECLILGIFTQGTRRVSVEITKSKEVQTQKSPKLRPKKYKSLGNFRLTTPQKSLIFGFGLGFLETTEIIVIFG